MAGGRLDVQLSPQMRLMVRGDSGKEFRPIDAPETSAHPSSASSVKRHNEGVYTTVLQVLSNRALNEVKGGFNVYGSLNDSIVTGRLSACRRGVHPGHAAHQPDRVRGRPGLRQLAAALQPEGLGPAR